MHFVQFLGFCKVLLISAPKGNRATASSGVDKGQVGHLIELDLLGHQAVKLVGNVKDAFVHAGHLLVRRSQAGGGHVHFDSAFGNLSDFFSPGFDHHARDRVLWCQEAVQQQVIALGNCAER